MAILNKDKTSTTVNIVERPFQNKVLEILEFYNGIRRQDLNMWIGADHIYDIEPPAFLREAVFVDYSKLLANVVIAHNQIEFEITFEFLDGPDEVFSISTNGEQISNPMRIAEWLCNLAYLQINQ